MKFRLKKLLRPGLFLVLVFLILVAIEGYLLYFKVYRSLSIGVDTKAINYNIVRLDLNNYNKTLKLLDELNSFSPPNLFINNPFD